MIRADIPPLPPLIAHRGASAHAPENTLAAFHLAADMGASWVEFDCMLSRDDAVIVYHDDTLDRTTNGKGLVARTTLSTIRTLDAGAWFHPRFSGESVPTLAETVMVLSSRGLGANIELKPTPDRDAITGRLVAEWIAAHWPTDLPPPVFSSFSRPALTAAARVCPDIPQALLFGRLPGDWQDQAEQAGATALHLKAQYLREQDARELTAHDMPFRCYTVNDPKDAVRLFSLGAQSVFTDDPGPIARVLPADAQKRMP